MKQIFAIPAAAAATPPKPRKAASNATTKNTQVYQSMCVYPFSQHSARMRPVASGFGVRLTFARNISTLAHAPELTAGSGESTFNCAEK